MPNTPEDQSRINAIRTLAIDAVQKANSGHPGLPLGAAAMAYTLFARHLSFNAGDSNWFDRDRFVLSAGHGSMLLYALLYLNGYDVSLDDLKAFRQLGSKTPGHPELHHTPGVEVTTGPLGQGLGNAVGLALAEAHLAATYNTRDHAIVDHHTYCLVGDGDLMEGVASEASSLAGHLRLGKLIVLYDDNKVSLAASTDVTFTEDVCARYAAYGWHVQAVTADDGNDVAAIDAALNAAKIDERPSLIAIRTIIGFGSPRANTFGAHGEPLGADNVRKTKEALGVPVEPPFFVPDETLAWWRENGRRGALAQARWTERFDAWSVANPELAAQLARARDERLPTISWPTFTAETGNVATREAGGMVLNAIAADLPELVGGSADLDPSTKTYLKGLGDMKPGDYAGRNIHFGVREHAMGAIANGLAVHAGIVPFTATFFNFVDYMKPAVRLAAINKTREIYVFTHDSVFLGEDGPTHQPIEQLATLRATPNLTTIRPADALETLEAWKFAIAHKGPTALVLSRQKVPFLGDRDADVARGAYIVYGTDDVPDMILIATGSEVSLAIAAAKLVERRPSTHVRVVSMPSFELFAQTDVAYRDRILPPAVRARVSIEAAATFGWHRWVGEHGLAIGIDHFGMSAPAADIATAIGFTPEAIADAAAGLLALTS